MISGLERRNSLRQGRHRPKQGDLCSESASSAGQQWSRVETRAPTSSAVSIFCPFATFSNASMACPEARKYCTREALICMSCHKQVQRWKCAAVERESLHTEGSSKYTKSTLPNCRRSPSFSLASNQRSITAFCKNPCYCTRLLQGCVQTRASAPRPRRHHTTVEVLCASGGCPGYLGELPLVRSTSIIVLVVKETVVVDRQGMVAGICPVGSTGTKLCGHTVSTA